MTKPVLTVTCGRCQTTVECCKAGRCKINPGVGVQPRMNTPPEKSLWNHGLPPGEKSLVNRVVAVEFPSHDDVVDALDWLREQPQVESTMEILRSTCPNSLVLRHILRIANGYDR